MKRAAWLLVAAGSLATGSLAAQEASILVGGVHARYADSVAGTAALVSARVGFAQRRTAAMFDASFSRFTTGETAVQVAGQGVLTLPLSGSVNLGVVGFGSARTFDGTNHSEIAAGGPVLLFTARRVGGSVRVGGGGVRRVDGTNLLLFTGEGRLDARVSGLVTLTAQAAASRTATAQFADAAAVVTLERGIVRLESGLGIRAGDLRDNPEWHVRFQVHPTISTVLEATAGEYPRDVSGFTSGGFASVGLRFTLPQRTVFTGRRSVAVERLGQARVKVSIAVPDAKAVAIAGEWNAWKPASLARDRAGRWSAELALLPGVYRFALLVNGDRWTVPDDITAVPDDFGGKAALLVIP
ncbi:MAG: hypothetical protein EXR93_04385 [Gemmatimonadetes bacterium]|nr:hypothetical protein [Gemmatimonadota bacterium]